MTETERQLWEAIIELRKRVAALEQRSNGSPLMPTNTEWPSRNLITPELT